MIWEDYHQRTRQLARHVVEQCRARGWTIATAESLTAGLCAASLAEIPGASAVLRGGFIVYATQLKAELAGVNPQLLQEHGPIHPRVAEQLAQGAAMRCHADIGMGLTGVAGPEPSDGHPVGEVYIGWHMRGRAPHSLSSERMTAIPERHMAKAQEHRAIIRQHAVNVALEGTLVRLEGADG